MSFELDFVDYSHVHQWSQDVSDELESELARIEAALKAELETFEKLAHYRHREDREEGSSSGRNSLLQITKRIASISKRFARAREGIVKENSELRKRLNDQKLLLEEMEMERDVLLQQIHSYLETNSSLRVRLEEQRCQAGALQRKVNENLESRVKCLESEKEELTDLNMEKDKQIHKITVMLEQTAKCLKNREKEALHRKNEENNLMTSLKAELSRTLVEKAKMEEKYAELKKLFKDYFFKNVEGPVPEEKNSQLKKSLSVGDLSRTDQNTTGKNTSEPFLDLPANGSSPQQVSKVTSEERLWRVHGSRSWPSGVTVSPQNAGDRLRKPSVHAQLNSLRRDLLNVTKKLELLKNQLMSSGVIREELDPSECRNLKRKARPIDESGGDVSEEQKSEFKNLRNILQDAKNLNAKLQNLREEKQKIIDMSQKETSIQMDKETKKEFSKTTHETGPSFEVCKSR